MYDAAQSVRCLTSAQFFALQASYLRDQQLLVKGPGHPEGLRPSRCITSVRFIADKHWWQLNLSDPADP